jgi:hypothetical protein
VRLEGLGKLIKSTLSGLEPETFRLSHLENVLKLKLYILVGYMFHMVLGNSFQ